METAENPRAVAGDNNPPSQRELLAEKPEHKALLDKLEDLAARANTAPKVLKSDADLGIVAQIIKDVRTFTREERAAFETEKEPLREAAKTVDQFFNETFVARYSKIAASMNARADDYQAEKDRLAREEARRQAEAARLEAERQAKLAEKHEGTKRAATATARAETAAERAGEAEAAANASAADLTRATVGESITASARREWSGVIEDYAKIDLNAMRDSFTVAEIEKVIARHAKKHEDRKPVKGVRFIGKVKSNIR